MTATHWQRWHEGYVDPGSDLSRRRRSVQRQIEQWLDSRDDAALSVVSACSGDGLDLLEVLAGRPDDARRVRARLLELDEGLAEKAETHADAHGLDQVEVRRADAGVTDSYLGSVPADLVMMCGVFGTPSSAERRPWVGRPESKIGAHRLDRGGTLENVQHRQIIIS